MSKRPDAAAPSPLHDGFVWPAEWDTHRRTWLCWPARAECFGGRDGMLRVKQAYARVARAISAFEPVVVGARFRATLSHQRQGPAFGGPMGVQRLGPEISSVYE